MSVVTVTGFTEKRNAKGGKFMVLNLEGDLTFSRSEETGAVFASAMKTNIIANLDKETCRALVGTQLAGSIKKIAVEPYTYITPDGGRKILDYKFEFFPAEEQVSIEEFQQQIS